MTSFDTTHNLIVYSEHPFNAAPPLDQVGQAYITSQELFFVRNHGTIPTIDPDSYRFIVDGLVQQPLHLSLDELRSTFTVVEVMATLQCAGNRRDELAAFTPTPGELPWGANAISNGVWRGVRLKDVLIAARVEDGAEHVTFTGLDEVERQGRRFGFGGSIPLAKALNSDVLLAYELNGAPLPVAHGFPLRVIAPGYLGARSVKWLGQITLQVKPSDNYFQTHAYKLFPPHIRPETVDWEGGEMLGNLAVNAVICCPNEGAMVEAGHVRVSGYALTGENRRIERVEVSSNGGVSWVVAHLVAEPQPNVWCLWEATLELVPGPHELIVRAWDDAGATQPEDIATVWNFKGYMNNAWHRVAISVHSRSAR